MQYKKKNRQQFSSQEMCNKHFNSIENNNNILMDDYV